MLDPSIKIVQAADNTATNRGGGFEKRLVLQFTVGNLGPFTEIFAAADQSEAQIHKRLNDKAALFHGLNAVEPGPAKG